MDINSEMKQSELVLEYLKQERIANQWISTVPSDISDAFFDNLYVNAREAQLNMLVKAFLPAEVVFDLDMYIEGGYSLSGSNSSIPFEINDDAKLVEMMKNWYGIE